MKVSKLIYLLIALGIILKAIKMYFVQSKMEYITLEQVYEWYFQVGYVGNLSMTAAGVLSFIFYKKYFPTYVSVCYVAMILLVALASINDFEQLLKKPAVFYSVKGIGTYANFGMLFFAASRDHFHKILKLFYYACFIFIAAGVINLGKVGLGSGRDQYLYAIRDFAVYLFWVFPFFALQDEQNKNRNFINIVTFLIVFIFILSTWSRSYLLLYILFFIAKFKEQLKAKNSLLVIVGMVVLVAGAFILFADTDIGRTIEGAVSNVSERTVEDSRSSQLVEFLEQFDMDYLMQGVGPFGTWYWSTIGYQYYYLDNQFLLLAWWAGLPTLLVYLYYVIKPIMKKSELTLFEDVKGIRMILVFWILACAGLAIYVGISADLYYDFITLLIGMQACKYTLLLSDEEDT